MNQLLQKIYSFFDSFLYKPPEQAMPLVNSNPPPHVPPKHVPFNDPVIVTRNFPDVHTDYTIPHVVGGPSVANGDDLSSNAKDLATKASMMVGSKIPFAGSILSVGSDALQSIGVNKKDSNLIIANPLIAQFAIPLSPVIDLFTPTNAAGMTDAQMQAWNASGCETSGAAGCGATLARLQGRMGTKQIVVNGEYVTVGGIGLGGPGWSQLTPEEVDTSYEPGNPYPTDDPTLAPISGSYPVNIGSESVERWAARVAVPTRNAPASVPMHPISVSRPSTYHVAAKQRVAHSRENPTEKDTHEELQSTNARARLYMGDRINEEYL